MSHPSRHASGPHESARLHVTGRARYVADMPGPANTVIGYPVCSTVARGTIRKLDFAECLGMPGVLDVLTRQDVPGENLWGPIAHTEPLFADGVVECVGQVLGVIIAETEAQARHAASRAVIEIEPLPPVVDLRAGIEAGEFLYGPHRIERGQITTAFDNAHLIIEHEVSTPGQDHFYLESQAAFAQLEEHGGIEILSSTQHPTEIQRVVAAVLGMHESRVVCKVPRLGGGFGGKESQASPFAAFAALAAKKTGRPCKVWLHRHQDMSMTGNRHPFFSKYRAAFAEDGKILGLDAELFSDGGWSLDLSGPVMDRALFHVDNAYYIPALSVVGHVVKTNTPSNTAFRGFGGPQGIVVIEDALSRAAESLGIDHAEIRRINLYGDGQKAITHYGQVIEENRLSQITEQLFESSAYEDRLSEIANFNAQSPWVKRGIGYQPVKFGISFTASLLNQAGALVHIYTDGSVQINHGGTEMGQGLHTKMIAVAAHTLGIDAAQVRLMTTSTDKVPNTSATAASSGSDLNGAAVESACSTLKGRLASVFIEACGLANTAIVKFVDGCLRADGHVMKFSEVAKLAWVKQVSLSATGYYATPGIEYDPKKGRGRPFFYFAFGGCVSEVEVNGLTGESRVRRVDILHDVGNPLAPLIDKGQVEGAFVQGMGWLTCEEVIYSGDGRLLTHGPSTYKIPAVGDVPLDWHVNLLENAPNQKVVGGSKAVGEPPFMLAISVVTALRNGIMAFGDGADPIELSLPATPEAILKAVYTRRAAKV